MHKGNPQISLFNLSYVIEGTTVKFTDFTHTFTPKKIGIIGDNGVGKSTLLKLIVGKLQPHAGSISLMAKVDYVEQDLRGFSDQLISSVLGVSDKLEALKRIEAGSLDPVDYEIIENDWDIKGNLAQGLQKFGLEHIQMNQEFGTLSGGQKTRIFLIKAMLSSADFLLLDEPTNNLDRQAREMLYQFVQNTEKGLLIVSHDRRLLHFTDEILEITSKGIHCYGGNYSDYVAQKEIHAAALERQLEDAKKSVKKVEKSIQQSLEKHDRKRSVGRKAFLDGKIDRATANSKQGRSERSQARMNKQEERMKDGAFEQLNSLKQQLEIKEEIHASLGKTYVPNGKMVLAIEGLSFAYPHSIKNLFSNFDLNIWGAERIALVGENGSGKTTLLKLITGELKPALGKINLGLEHWTYLNQEVSFLDMDQTLVENFKRLNPEETTTNCYHALAQFKFRNKEAEKCVAHLSGGERIRAGLACVLMSQTPPQLLILDEPTNHLDLQSILAIENIINQFQGALIVVSHDVEFLNNIGVGRYIDLLHFCLA